MGAAVRSISAQAQAEILKQRNSAYHWLYEISLEYSTITWRKLYATSHDGPVTWNGNTYDPEWVLHRGIAADSSGNLPTVELVAQNVTRELAQYAWDTRGFSGLPVTIHIVSKNALGAGDSILSQTFTVTTCSMESVVLTARLGAPPWLEYEVPADTYARNQCQHVYKDPLTCQYRGSLPSCDLTLFGPNGCVVHGQDEVANGRPPRHPALYGGFPAIPSIPV